MGLRPWKPLLNVPTMTADVDHLTQRFAEALIAKDAWVTCVESCTGGGISAQLTSVPGSSRWLEMGFVTYSNRAKTQLVNVSPALLAEHGAVSEAVVSAMAQGALEASGADLALAVSGIAGPDGGSPAKPVGTVWLACADSGYCEAERHQFAGDRAAVRQHSINAALSLALRFIAQHWNTV